jgi:hypothetical protein
MAGSYCRYCGHRCFVERVIPADGITGHAGQTRHLATCAEGKKHDRRTTGYDADSAINPHQGTIDYAKLLNEVESGPDAHYEIPNGCSCGGDVTWGIAYKWRNYPDGNLVDVECEGCGAGGEIDLRTVAR